MLVAMPHRRSLVHNRNASRCVYLSASIASLVFLGCGPSQQVDPNRASVSGTVTFDGKPLPAGTIIFASTEGSIASTISIAEGGRYASDRAPLGPNQVTISTESIQFGNPPNYVPIPARYTDPTQSGLTADIKSGVNENVNFDLKK